MSSLRDELFYHKKLSQDALPTLVEQNTKILHLAEQRQIQDPEEIKRRGYATITVEKELVRVGTANTAELMYSLLTAPVLDSLSKITVPVLIFNGSRDYCPIDWGHRYVKIFPQAKLYTIPAACHDPLLSDPKKFAAKSVEFIRKVAKDREKL